MRSMKNSAFSWATQVISDSSKSPSDNKEVDYETNTQVLTTGYI